MLSSTLTIVFIQETREPFVPANVNSIIREQQRAIPVKANEVEGNKFDHVLSDRASTTESLN